LFTHSLTARSRCGNCFKVLYPHIFSYVNGVVVDDDDDDDDDNNNNNNKPKIF
jgi:hypothetical protein